MRWKTATPFVVALVVCVFAAGGAAADSPELFLAPLVQSGADADCSAPAEQTLDALLGLPEPELVCTKCPNRCSSDSQCTAICGGVPGSCVAVNSCCRQCACSA